MAESVDKQDEQEIEAPDLEAAEAEAPARVPGPPPMPPRSPEERAAERSERRAVRARARTAWRAKQREKRRSRTSSPPLAPVPHETGRPRERQGVVVSDKADKTISVRIDVTRQHPVYKKTIRESSTLHAHDERNEAHEGDTVRVVESRPLSATKRWRLIGVLERAR